MTASGRHRPRTHPAPQAARGRGVRRRPAPLGGALGAGEGVDAERRADVVAPHVLRSSAAVRRRGEGRALPRRRRARVLGLQHRGHVDVRRIRAGAGRGGRLPTRRAGNAVPPSERGRAVGRRGAGPPLRASEVAVHAQRDACEHRGDPRRARAHRPGQGPVLRREVPRALRRGARRPAGREARAGGGRPAARRHVQDEDGAVQRPRGAASRARTARRRRSSSRSRR